MWYYVIKTLFFGGDFMIKEYSQNRNNVVINFSKKYCDTSQELLDSTGFNKVLSKYITVLKKKDASLIDRLHKIIDEDCLATSLLKLFKLLLVLNSGEVKLISTEYKTLLNTSSDLIEFVEGFYNYWRTLERYALIQSTSTAEGIENVNFVEANNNFTNLILKVYRVIEENILGYTHNVYRQLNAGINVGVVLSETYADIPTEYESLKDILFIKSVVITPPFIIYPKRNKRSGVFKEVYSNPLSEVKINKSHYFCYPAKVGESLAFIYFHRDYMNHGISLSNLFELAKPSECEGKSPNIVYVFGAKLPNKEAKTVFYSDKKNDLYVGFASSSDEIDYFGYMKKMILTLHNTRMIDKGHLPIHGAMVNITLKNGKTSNVAIIGDSGAGKSESLESFRKLSKKYLKEMKIIFDDMGIFKIENGDIIGYGTETGAFVRLDDLENGFAFGAIDRAIVMNPNKINARLLYPVSSFKDIIKGYKIDLLLYANNYEDAKDEMVFFSDKTSAVDVFKRGLRKAKGTTSETGIVESYFANPFGPLQRMAQTDLIIDSVFSKLFENKILVGELYTKLGIEGREQKGPENAAKRIFEYLMKE